MPNVCLAVSRTLTGSAIAKQLDDNMALGEDAFSLSFV